MKSFTTIGFIVSLASGWILQSGQDFFKDWMAVG